MSKFLVFLIVLTVLIGVLFYIKNRPPIISKLEIPKIMPSLQPIINFPETKILEVPKPVKPTSTIQEINLNITENGIEPNEIKIKEGDLLKITIYNTLTTSTQIEIKNSDFSTSTGLIEPAKEEFIVIKFSHKGEYKIYLNENIENPIGKIIVE